MPLTTCAHRGLFLVDLFFFLLLLTFEMRVPPWNCRSHAGSSTTTGKKEKKMRQASKKKAVMTFSLVALSTESKGGISTRSTVADTHLRACELCGGQPLVGLRESQRQSRPFRSSQLFVVIAVVVFFWVFFFLSFLICSLFYMLLAFRLSVMSNRVKNKKIIPSTNIAWKVLICGHKKITVFFLLLLLENGILLFPLLLLKNRGETGRWGSCVQSHGLKSGKEGCRRQKKSTQSEKDLRCKLWVREPAFRAWMCVQNQFPPQGFLGPIESIKHSRLRL